MLHLQNLLQENCNFHKRSFERSLPFTFNCYNNHRDSIFPTIQAFSSEREKRTFGKRSFLFFNHIAFGMLSNMLSLQTSFRCSLRTKNFAIVDKIILRALKLYSMFQKLQAINNLVTAKTKSLSFSKGVS